MKERLLTPNLTPGECGGLRQIGPYLLVAVGVLGVGHSPESEQLTWELKVTEGSAEGHMA